MGVDINMYGYNMGHGHPGHWGHGGYYGHGMGYPSWGYPYPIGGFYPPYQWGHYYGHHQGYHHW